MATYLSTIEMTWRHKTDGGLESQAGGSVPLGSLTAVTASGGSTLSAVVLAMRLLQRLSSGEDIATAIAELPMLPDGGWPLRALTGPSWNVAHLGCDVSEPDDSTEMRFIDPAVAEYRLRFEVASYDRPRIQMEELSGLAPAEYSGAWARRRLLQRVWGSTVFPDHPTVAGLFDGRAGTRPHHAFHSAGLLTPHLVRALDYTRPLDWPPTSESRRAVIRAADAIISALENITVLEAITNDVRRRGGSGGSAPRIFPSGAGTIDVLAHLYKLAPEAYKAIREATCPNGLDGNSFYGWACRARGRSARFLAVATALAAPPEYFATEGPAPADTRAKQLLLVIDEPLRDAPLREATDLRPLLQICKQWPGKRVVLSTESTACLAAVRDVYGMQAVFDLDDNPRT